MRRQFTSLCFLFSLSSCAMHTQPIPESLARIDHVIVGVADLDDGIAQMKRMTGVTAVFGGAHPGQGTRNALMSLGDATYLELLAPDPNQNIDNDEVRELARLARPTPIGWAVSGTGEARLRATFGPTGIRLSPSEPGARRKPDGSILHWVTLGYEMLDDALAPFFIFWAEPALHPAPTSPGGCTLERLKIEHQSASQLRSALAPLRLNVTVAQASTPRLLLSLQCGARTVRLGAA